MEGSLNLPEQAILDLFLAMRSNIGFAAIGPEESATRRIAVRARHILGVSSANRKLSRNGALGNWPIARRFLWSSTAGHAQHRPELKLHLLSFAKEERSRCRQAWTKGREGDRQARPGILRGFTTLGPSANLLNLKKLIEYPTRVFVLSEPCEP